MHNIYIQEPTTCGKVVLDTTVGDIEIELFSKECPLACRNFLQLCVDGYYDGTFFHRVVPNFIVQGGHSTGTGEGGESATGEFFPDEVHTQLRFNRRGLVGIVNQGPNTNASQFFFTLGPTPELDKKNTLFGKIVGNTLFNMLKLGEGEFINETPVHKQKIIKTKIISNPFDNMIPRSRPKPQIIDKDEENKKSKSTLSAKAIKNYGLSFETEDEEEITKISMKFKEKGTRKSANNLTLSKSTVRFDEDDEQSDKELPIKKQTLKAKEKNDEDFDKEGLDPIQQRFNEKKLAKQKKKKQVVLDADDDDNQQEISSSKFNENVKLKIERLEKQLKKLKKSSIRIKSSEDIVQEGTESAPHRIHSITTDSFVLMDELMTGTTRWNKKTHSTHLSSRESQTLDLNMSHSKRTRSPSPVPPETPRYNLRSKKRAGEPTDHSTEESIYVKIDEDTLISVTDLIHLFDELIEYKNVKPRQDRSQDIQNQINKIDKIIEQYFLKLPSLTTAEEKQLLISNVETNLKVRKKQFYYVILYYMINKHWPYIKKQAPSLRDLGTFFKLLEFLIDKQILKQFDENFDENDVFISYLITGVAYLVVANDPCCSVESVEDFTVVLSHGFRLVDTSNQAFIYFFTLLQTILSTPFIVQLCCELINDEEDVSRQTIEQSLQDNISKLKIHLYLADLSDYYCALTLYDGKLLLNGSERGLFKAIDEMIRFNWELNSNDDLMIKRWAALLIVIIHEIAHSLRRTIIPKARNLILAQKPPKGIDDSTGEARFCLETSLFGDKVHSIGLQDGEYLLNAANWNVVNVERFQHKFKQAMVKDKKHSNQGRLKLPSRCIEGSGHDTRIRIGDCGTSQYAIHLNN
ncbi:unnamed protein product [Rotaria sp. Silwood1]|nr:unnamed protein product [Rotaria sp. Silwood1]